MKPRGMPLHDERQLPYNVEMEQRLLGAILQDNDRYWDISEILKPAIFYDPLHQRIVTAIAARIEHGDKANHLTIATDMKDDPSWEHVVVGGQEYLHSMILAAEALPALDEYVTILREFARRRGVIRIAVEISDEAYKPTDNLPIAPVIQYGQERLFELMHDPNLGEGPRPSDVMFDASLAESEQIANAPNQARISTGLPSVDRMLGGFFNGHLYIVAAPPSVGKSGLMAQFAKTAANTGYFSLIYSLEMAGPDITTRYLAADIGIPVSDIVEGHITHDDVQRMALARREYGDAFKLFIDSKTGASVSDIRTSAQTVRHRHGNLDFLLVDHLRLIRPDDPRSPEHERLDQITRDLKSIAIDFHIPVLVVATFNREFWKRPSKRPLISDIYGSAAIEYNADHIWFLHREEFFLERDEPPASNQKEHDDWARALDQARGKAELFSVKRRNGPTGSVKLRFDAKFIRFYEL